jgi:purine-binding chemotaxis protein CheW
VLFSIERDFAIKLKDVQEILENIAIIPVYDTSGLLNGVINLRGKIVPVVNLRKFFGYPDKKESGSKLIVAVSGSSIIAMEVDDVFSILRKEKYYNTPSLNPQLRERQDTLDRTIEIDGSKNSQKSHVLVLNIQNIINNHLHLVPADNLDRVSVGR